MCISDRDGEDAAGRCQPPQQPGGRGGAHAGVSAGAAGIIPYQQEQVRLKLHDSPDVAQRPHVIKGRGHQVKVNETVKLFKSYHPDYRDGWQLRDFVWVGDCVNVVL